jgi:hypothetical protein
MSEQDKTDRLKQLSIIEQGFWARSYLRAKFGTKIGTFNPVTFEKGKLNIKDLVVGRNKLMQMREEPAYTDAELVEAMGNIREVVNVLAMRTVDFKSSSEPILARAYAFAHWATGGSTGSEAIMMMMTLMAADIKEEQIITTEGIDALKKNYQLRYQPSEEMKTRYAGFKCDWDKTAKGCAAGSASLVAGSQDTGSLRGAFNDLNSASLVQYAQNIAKGAEINKQVDLAQESLAGELLKGINDNTGDL